MGAILGFLKLIPWQIYAGIAVVVALGTMHLTLVHKAVKANDGKWEQRIAAEQAAYAKKVAELQAKQSAVVERTVVQFRDRVKVIKEKGDEIVKEVPSLVGTECALTGGMRVLHDSAALGSLPDDPIGAARAAASVDAVTLGATVAQNYAACRAEFAKLTSLQQLVTSLKEIK